MAFDASTARRAEGARDGLGRFTEHARRRWGLVLRWHGLVASLVFAACPGAPVPGDAGSRPDAGPVEPLDGGRWTTLRALPQPQQECGVAALDGFVYVVGGFGPGDQPVADVFRLDVSGGSWQRVRSLPRPMHHPNVAAVGGRLYLVGALEGAGFTATGEVLRYDPAIDQWTRRTSMPSTSMRGACAVGVIGEEIYLAGGYREGARSQVSVYSTTSDTHRELEALPAAADHLAGAVVDGRFFVIGGRRTEVTRVVGRVAVLDPATGGWTELAPMPTARGGHAAAVLGRSIVVVGGEGNPLATTGVFGETEVFEVDVGRWFSGPAMPTPRHGTGAATVDGLVVVPGGAAFDGLAPATTVEAFGF